MADRRCGVQVASANNTYSGSGVGGGHGGDEKDDAGAALLMDFYTRVYPTVDELTMDLDDLEEGELADIVTELKTEVEALRAETGMLERNVTHNRTRANGGGGNNNASGLGQTGSMTNAVDSLFAGVGGGGGGLDDTTAATAHNTTSHDSSSSGSYFLNSANNNATVSSSAGGHGNTRRGKSYHRRSQDEAAAMLVGVTEKLAMLAREREGLNRQEAVAARQAEQVRDLLTATVEEAVRRLKELRLEFRHFCREVLHTDAKDDNNYGTSGGGGGRPATSAAAAATASATIANSTGRAVITIDVPDGSGREVTGSASADDLLRFLQRSAQAQRGYLDKLHVQCKAAEQEITRAQLQLRQRRAAGEAFNAVDFAQLRIENEQFTERTEKKNTELADLKGTSTRAVQTLNTLMDTLNELSTEQAQLRKELRSRGEYLSRCATEVGAVAVEATGAERRNRTIKAQHEAVRVPKIEEYIAQTAELFELEKAFKNWSRKVEIAEGQASVLRHQSRRLKEQRTAAVAYADAKRFKFQSRQSHAQHAQQRSRTAPSAAADTTTARTSMTGSVGGGGAATAAAASAHSSVLRPPAHSPDRKADATAAAATGGGEGVPSPEAAAASSPSAINTSAGTTAPPVVGGAKSLLQMKRAGQSGGGGGTGTTPAASGGKKQKGSKVAAVTTTATQPSAAAAAVVGGASSSSPFPSDANGNPALTSPSPPPPPLAVADMTSGGKDGGSERGSDTDGTGTIAGAASTAAPEEDL